MNLKSLKSSSFHNHSFSIFALGFLLCFAFTRLPYFLNYDIPGFTRGTLDYYNSKVIYLLEGKLPVFERVPPIYPMFLYLCHVLGLYINQILFIQCILSMLTLMVCQYLINKYLPGYRWIFFIVAILFYASGRYINYNTRIEAMGMFTDLAILIAVLIAVALVTKRKLYFIFVSIAIAALVLIRHQGLFMIPLIAFITSILLTKKHFAQVLSISFPLFFILAVVFIYNKNTFGNFFFGKYQLGTALGGTVYYLDDTGNYSEELKSVINKVKASFSDEDMRILEDSWCPMELSKVFQVSNYDKYWEFNSLFYTHEEELRQLVTNSKRLHPTFQFKFIYTNFINCFLVNYEDYYFYYNELVNRIYYIERTNEFTLMNLPEKDYRIIFNEYADVIFKRILLSKTGIIPEDLDYARNFGDERFFVKLNHYYQMLYAVILTNIVWLLLLFITVAASIIIIFRSKFRDNEIILLQIPFVLILLNYALVSITITPLDSYVFPTRFFMYFYPVSIIYYLLVHNVNHRLRTHHRDAMPQ